MVKRLNKWCLYIDIFKYQLKVRPEWYLEIGMTTDDGGKVIAKNEMYVEVQYDNGN